MVTFIIYVRMRLGRSSTRNSLFAKDLQVMVAGIIFYHFSLGTRGLELENKGLRFFATLAENIFIFTQSNLFSLKKCLQDALHLLIQQSVPIKSARDIH